MVKLLRRIVLLGSAGTVGWLYWTKRQSSHSRSQQASSTFASANGAGRGAPWPPIPPDGTDTKSAAPNRSAQSFADVQADVRADADAALDLAAAALAAEQIAEAKAEAALNVAASALAAEHAAEADAAIANAQADAALDLAATAIAAQEAAEADAAAARADVVNAAAAVDWNLKWVPPNDDGSCPLSHPIKGNDGSKIFHVPEGRSYGRTRAERCYATAADAEADGYRQSKR